MLLLCLTSLFTLRGSFLDILFDFECTVDESKIPGARFGAFLTFLGARKLDKKLQEKREAFRAQVEYRELPTMKSLTARLPGGFHASVSLTGDDLHGNNNSEYFCIQNASSDCGNKENHDHPTSGHAIDQFKLFTESDYKQDSSIKFYPASNLLHLGRYGPFRKRDRKTEPLYQVCHLSSDLRLCQLTSQLFSSFSSVDKKFLFR